MADTQYNKLNVYIDGDRSGFNSKASIEKFKATIKKSVDFKLEDQALNKFIKPEYKLEMLDKTNDYIKFNIVKKLDNKTEYENKRALLKDKLKNMYRARTNLGYYKAKNDKNVPDDILTEYKKLSRVSKIPILDPSEVLGNVEKYKPLVSMFISNGVTNKMPSSHPYVKYYKLLAEKIGAEPILPMPTKDFNLMNNPVVNVKGNDITLNEETDTENEINV